MVPQRHAKDTAMVEMIGLEPTTSCVQGRRSPTELHPQNVEENGGPREIRTSDLSVISRVL